MSLFSEFREKLKVKTEEKRVRKYSNQDIHIREDKQTENLELYLVKKYSGESEGKGWKTHRFRMRDINIRNPENKIDYTFVVSPSGRFYRREYDDYEQERIYSRLYSIPCVLQQILGVSIEEADKMQFTMEELVELIEKINKERADAIYQFVDLVQYSDSYKGRRVLEGLHIARAHRFNLDSNRDFRCVEDENIKVKMNENGALTIIKDGEKEMISAKNFEFISTKILPCVQSHRYSTLGGYTIEAVRKVVKEYKKEKDSEREEK